jgi:hypothetical protein
MKLGMVKTSMMKENWKDIEGHHNYQVSNLGNVRNVLKGRSLAGWTNSDGYRIVKLFDNGKFCQISVHRLVAITFVPNPDNLLEVNHLDGDKQNNMVSNLEWSTRSNNVSHAYRVLQCKSGFRSNIGIISASKRKKVKQMDINGNEVKVWSSASEASRDLSICRTSISDCCNSRLQIAGGFKWVFC